MSKNKKNCNCSCRCKSPQLPLVLVSRRAFPRGDGLNDMGPLPVMDFIQKRRVNARTAVMDYLSDTGLIDSARLTAAASEAFPGVGGKNGYSG
jgi:hypothetical protein